VCFDPHTGLLIGVRFKLIPLFFRGTMSSSPAIALELDEIRDFLRAGPFWRRPDFVWPNSIPTSAALPRQAFPLSNPTPLIPIKGFPPASKEIWLPPFLFVGDRILCMKYLGIPLHFPLFFF